MFKQQLSQWEGWQAYKEQCVESSFDLPVSNGEVKIKVFVIKTRETEPTGNSAFVFAHGSGLNGTLLSAEENLAECYRYAVDWNCIVFSVDYRKAPETKCPNQ